MAVSRSWRRAALEGIDRAGSINVDPHKWLFQPYEAGCILVRDAGTLERAFAIQHDVLQDSVWGAKHANLADQGIQLSRSFRALKIWMSIQTFGMAAFRAAIENGLDLAARAAEYTRRSPTLELLSVALSMVCFRVNPGGLSEDALARPQPPGACGRVLGRAGVPVVHHGQQAICPAAVYPEPQYNVG